MKGFSLLVTIAVSAGYAHGAGATLRASVETMLDSTSSCNPNQESFLVCLDGSTGTAWNSCGPKNGRKYCPKGYAMCGDGSCFRKSSQCFRRGRGGLEYGKSVCAAEPTCNPNHLDVLVCSDGSKGKGASDWNACGRNWKKSGSRKYCPRGFYQCGNGLCSKHKNACRGSPLKFVPCEAVVGEASEAVGMPVSWCKYSREELEARAEKAEKELGVVKRASKKELAKTEKDVVYHINALKDCDFTRDLEYNELNEVERRADKAEKELDVVKRASKKELAETKAHLSFVRDELIAAVTRAKKAEMELDRARKWRKKKEAEKEI